MQKYEYIKIFCRYPDDEIPAVFLYEVDTENERYAVRMAEIYHDRKVKKITDDTSGFVTEAPVPDTDFFNRQEEFYAENISKKEFEIIYNSTKISRDNIDFPLVKIWFEFDNWSDGFDEYDANADVIFGLNDGSAWCASFYTYKNLLGLSEKNRKTGENLSGKYFYADKPIFIEKMDKNLIISVIKSIISENHGDLSDIFTESEFINQGDF